MSGGKLTISFNYCCISEKIEINGTFSDKIIQLKTITESNFVGSIVTYSNFSSQELLRLYQTHKNQRLSISFKENPLSTSYSEYGIGYVGTVNLKDYKLFLTDEDGSIRDDLFESNIRHFQGQVDVNKKIKNTINNIDNKDFWWLNNGITIIATNPTQIGKTLSIDGVQIVNGLQTSYSIFNHLAHSIDDTRSVLVKVIINDDKETIDRIIASTNSQNPVSPALLRATDDIQRELELFYLTSGYFYDRRKNYYKNHGKPANRIFSIQTTAQVIESIIYRNPYSARSKPTTLIKDDSNYSRIFNPEVNFQAYLNCCLLYKKTSEYWGQIQDSNKKRKISNFKLHLSRICASFITSLSEYSIAEIENLKTSDLNEERFQEAVDLLISAIDDYQTTHPDANLINMAKAKGLTDELKKKLDDKFN
ncbi:MAG: AIPR family protein [Bacteroidota bacterium]